MVPYLRAANVEDGHLSLDDVKEMDYTPTEQQIFALRSGDVLVTEGSGSLATVGATAVYRGEFDSIVCFQNTLLRLRPKTAELEPRFLAWWARGAYENGSFAAVASGANIHHLGAEGVKSMAITLPPLHVQSRIADYLDRETERIQHATRLNDRLLEALREHRARLVLDAVTGKADPSRSEPTWHGMCRGPWPFAQYRRLAEIGTGHTPSRSVPYYWEDCSIPWVTTADVHRFRNDEIDTLDDTTHHISEAGLAHSAAVLHPKGTVVLSRTASVGFSAILGCAAAVSQDFVVWRPSANLDPEYVLWSLRAMRYVGHFNLLMAGSTHKTMYWDSVSAIGGPIPPLGDQQAIATRIKHYVAKSSRTEAALKQQNELLRERRQALITAAVTGQLDLGEVA